MRWVVLTPEVRLFCAGCEGPLRWHRLEGWHDQAWELTKAEQIWYDDVGVSQGKEDPRKDFVEMHLEDYRACKGAGMMNSHSQKDPSRKMKSGQTCGNRERW